MMAGINDSLASFEQEVIESVLINGSMINLKNFALFQVEKLKGYMAKMDEDINRIVKLYSTDLNNYKVCQGTFESC